MARLTPLGHPGNWDTLHLSDDFQSPQEDNQLAGQALLLEKIFRKSSKLPANLKAEGFTSDRLSHASTASYDPFSSFDGGLGSFGATSGGFSSFGSNDISGEDLGDGLQPFGKVGISFSPSKLRVNQVCRSLAPPTDLHNKASRPPPGLPSPWQLQRQALAVDHDPFPVAAKHMAPAVSEVPSSKLWTPGFRSPPGLSTQSKKSPSKAAPRPAQRQHLEVQNKQLQLQNEELQQLLRLTWSQQAQQAEQGLADDPWYCMPAQVGSALQFNNYLDVPQAAVKSKPPAPPLPSCGSARHGLPGACCRPCQSFWQASGCSEGRACTYCHLCPRGSVDMDVVALSTERRDETTSSDHLAEEPAVDVEKLQELLVRQVENTPVVLDLHEDGACRPCTWFWKAQGCQKAEACAHCHMCPESAIQEKKRAKRLAIRSRRQEVTGI